MRPSSALCRAQETLQRNRAVEATLDNVRIVAEKAADAWSREALWAKQREDRRDQVYAKSNSSEENDRLSREHHDRSLSENPDRGLAYPMANVGKKRSQGI